MLYNININDDNKDIMAVPLYHLMHLPSIELPLKFHLCHCLLSSHGKGFNSFAVFLSCALLYLLYAGKVLYIFHFISQISYILDFFLLFSSF